MTSFDDLYVAEVRRQCIFAVKSHEEIKKEISKLPNWDDINVWFSLQNLLVAGANVSKLLWPKTDIALGQRIRARLNVTEPSPLQEKALRNRIEHFDEYMIDWNRRSVNRNYVDSNFGIPLSGFDPIDIMRNYNPSTNEFIFGGVTYKLNPLVEAIKIVKAETEK